MKHYFIINPAAGPMDPTVWVRKRIEAFEEWEDFDWETYITTGPGDAAVYSSILCREHPEEPKRLYACGGDGTLNEVVTGAMGHPNVAVTHFPVGSGNDFIKAFGARSDFSDIDRLVEGVAVPIDVMRITCGRGDDAPVRYCFNVAGMGFDATVGQNMQKFKRFPLIGGKRAYNSAIIYSFFFNRRSHYKVTVDGQVFCNEPVLFCTLCNGNYEGGGIKVAPFAKVDDGVLDIYRIKPISTFNFARLIGPYRQGEHVDNPEFHNYIDFCQGTDVVIECKKTMPFMVDGEVLSGKYFHVELLHHALDFVIPKGL